MSAMAANGPELPNGTTSSGGTVSAQSTHKPAMPEGLQKTERLTEPEGMLQGQNTRGSVGYFGPRPPLGAPAHRYYFQLLALDTTLDLLPAATRDEVLSAAKGHVVGYGNLMGRYQQAQPPRK